MQDHFWACLPIPFYCADGYGCHAEDNDCAQELPAYVRCAPRRRRHCRPTNADCADAAPACPQTTEGATRVCVEYAAAPYQCRARLCARICLPAGVCVKSLCVNIDAIEQQYCGCRYYAKVCFTITICYKDRCGQMMQSVSQAANCFALPRELSEDLSATVVGKPSFSCNNGCLCVCADIRISG